MAGKRNRYIKSKSSVMFSVLYIRHLKTYNDEIDKKVIRKRIPIFC